MRETRSSTLKMLVERAPTDRQIEKMPAPFKGAATPYVSADFSAIVREACVSSRFITAGLKISKVIIIGNMGAGKTCMVNRFCHSVFDSNYKATIGVDFEVERFDILRVPFNLQIWDTAGQERFKCIAASYYRGAHAIVVVFDLTDLYSLSACAKWLEDALAANLIRPLVFLVGTKRDLLSNAAYQSVEEQAVRTAQALQAEFWAVSSKTGFNVDSFFSRMAALTFDVSVAKEFDQRCGEEMKEIGNNELIKLQGDEESPGKAKLNSKCARCGK